MVINEPTKLSVFIDADVLFAATASGSEYSASLVILRLAEITLIKVVASEQVIIEVERNLIIKLPNALPAFRRIVDRCLNVVPSPTLDTI